MLGALFFASGMLLVGSFLRVKLRLLQRLFVPAAMVGGLVGLSVIQLASALLPEPPPSDSPISRRQGQATNVDPVAGEQPFPRLAAAKLDQTTSQLRAWPGQLIAVVFAGLFLERRGRSLRESARLAWREGLVVWIIVLGQTTLGLMATWLLIQPFFDVPNAFGMLIETGFAGGHGTAAAMGEVFQTPMVQLQNGRDLGMFMATMGLAISVITGMAYVNVAVRRGWTRAGDVRIEPIRGLEDRHDPPAIAWARIRSEVVDPMAFQLLLLAAAVAVGVVLEYGVSLAAMAVDRFVFPAPAVAPETGRPPADGPNDGRPAADTEETEASRRDREMATESRQIARIIGSFPLFIYTLFGGLLVRKAMQWLGVDDLIDPGSIQRWVGVAMEFLIVAAIATLNLFAVAAFAGPLIILLVVALAWTGFCLIYVSRWFLPRAYWFELGIINYGMSTGTTATGFVLLRAIDKDLNSGAAEDYALAAPLSSPFVGGGMLTVGLPLLVLERVPIGVTTCVLASVLLGLTLLARRLADKPDVVS